MVSTKADSVHIQNEATGEERNCTPQQWTETFEPAGWTKVEEPEELRAGEERRDDREERRDDRGDGREDRRDDRQ